MLKFVVCGFIEFLCQELDIESCGVLAICVYFGGIKINIVCNVWMIKSMENLIGMVSVENMCDSFEVLFMIIVE